MQFFFFRQALAGIFFFSKSPPPPQELNGRPLRFEDKEDNKDETRLKLFFSFFSKNRHPESFIGFFPFEIEDNTIIFIEDGRLSPLP